MTLIEDIASFVARQKSAVIPDAVLDQAHRAVANWCAVALHAAKTSEGQVFLSALTSVDAGGVSVAGGRKSSAFEAALLNGALGHVDDFDDTHLGTVAHPSTPVIAAALAACSPHTTWDEFLTAVALGTELNIRMAELLNPGHYDIGWHITASVGGIGSAAAAAFLWDLPEERIAHACALAAVQPVGLRVSFGTMAKAFQVGRSAENGLAAAHFARVGTTGPLDGIEHHRGLRITSPDFNPEQLKGIGETWVFLDDTFKPYPCGIVTHPVIDAACALHDKISNAEDVEEVTAVVNPLVIELTGKRSPRNGLEIKFSATGLVAIGLATGSVVPDDFERPMAREVEGLEKRVNLEAQESIPRDAALLRIRLKDGSQLEQSVEHARGSIAHPLTWEDIKKKFIDCTKSYSTSEELWRQVAAKGGKPVDLLQSH